MVCLITLFAFLYNRYPQLHFFFPSNIQRRTTKYLAVFCWDSLLFGTGLGLFTFWYWAGTLYFLVLGWDSDFECTYYETLPSGRTECGCCMGSLWTIHTYVVWLASLLGKFTGWSVSSK